MKRKVDQSEKLLRRTNNIAHLKKHYLLYLMLVLPVLYYIIFHYIPMGGLVIAFKDYKIGRGIWASEWVGLDVFKRLLGTSKFWRAFKNTVRLNILNLVVGFPAPIILALLLNEIKDGLFKKGIQTVLYLPHFISWVIIGGLVIQVFSPETGMLNNFFAKINLPKIPFLSDNFWWIVTYVLVNVWQTVGWGAIIYISAIAGIDQEQYEAAAIDGCSRFKMMFKITLPNLYPTIAIMLILRMGSMLGSSLEIAQMLNNTQVIEVADVLASYIYDVGMYNGKYSIGTAAGLFLSILNFILVVASNKISDKLTGYSVW